MLRRHAGNAVLAEANRDGLHVVGHDRIAGYKKEAGVAADSRVETFAALRVAIDSWRWKRVPFYIRAGKCLPVTCTEVVLRLRQPPTMYHGFDLQQNYCRFRISPDIAFAVGANIVAPRHDGASQIVEMVGTRLPARDEVDAYERVLGDAMAGDSTLFAREDYVQDAWRVVDEALRADTPLYEYEPGTWGPTEVGRRLVPPRAVGKTRARARSLVLARRTAHTSRAFAARWASRRETVHDVIDDSAGCRGSSSRRARPRGRVPRPGRG